MPLSRPLPLDPPTERLVGNAPAIQALRTQIRHLAAFDTLGRRLDDARRQHEDAKALDDALFGEDFETG